MESTDKRQRKEDAGSTCNGSATCTEGLSATQYLALVSQEAKAMPNVFVESSSSTEISKGDDEQQAVSASSSHRATKRKRSMVVPIDGSAASLSYLLSGRASLTPAPSPRHLPNNIQDWTNAVISNFEQLRDYLEKCRTLGVGGRQSRRMPLPPMKDRASWRIFCVGDDHETCTGDKEDGPPSRDDDNNNNNNSQQQSSRNAEGTKKPSSPSGSATAAWRANLPEQGYTPTTQLLCQMDQVMVRHVLSHLTHFVHVGEVCNSKQLSKWIYALLARLEKPIHRHDAAVLFSLLKDLCRARSKVNCDHATADEELPTLNTLIVLIGMYFEQGGGVNGVMRSA